MKCLPRRTPVHIGFIDDSGSTGASLDVKRPYQLVGGPLVLDTHYTTVELGLAITIQEAVPEEKWDSFEFHAEEMYKAEKSPYREIGQTECHKLIMDALGWMVNFEMPILLGTVDRRKIAGTVFHSMDPIDVAFTYYLDSLQEWFEELSKSSEESFTSGILIADASRNKNGDDLNKKFRKTLFDTFRRMRTKPHPDEGPRGIANYLVDDIYFGDSKYSVGLQLADLSLYFIARHLAGDRVTEGFYNTIKDLVYNPRGLPDLPASSEIMDI